MAEDRITEDEISVLLKRTRSTPESEERQTIAFKPQPGETVAELVQRVLTTPKLSLESAEGEFHRQYSQRMEIRLVVGADVPGYAF